MYIYIYIYIWGALGLVGPSNGLRRVRRTQGQAEVYNGMR